MRSKFLNGNNILITLPILSSISLFISFFFNIYLIEHQSPQISARFFSDFSFGAMIAAPTTSIIKSILLKYEFEIPYISNLTKLLIALFIIVIVFSFPRIFLLASTIYIIPETISFKFVRGEKHILGLIFQKILPYLFLFSSFYYLSFSNDDLFTIYITAFGLSVFTLLIILFLKVENRVNRSTTTFKKVTKGISLQLVVNQFNQGVIWLPIQYFNFLGLTESVIFYRLLIQLRTLLLVPFNSFRSKIIVFLIGTNSIIQNQSHLKSIRVLRLFSIIGALLIALAILFALQVDLETKTLILLKSNQYYLLFG
ncbi:hypothetical protein, partial [Nonlabens sp.]|uniref:hypothetical protein n=1 Tax=Nonlabens sp. TaxID=1888209 RepID=UPI001BD07DE4